MQLFSWYGVIGCRVFAPTDARDYSTWAVVGEQAHMGQSSLGKHYQPLPSRLLISLFIVLSCLLFSALLKVPKQFPDIANMNTSTGIGSGAGVHWNNVMPWGPSFDFVDSNVYTVGPGEHESWGMHSCWENAKNTRGWDEKEPGNDLRPEPQKK